MTPAAAAAPIDESDQAAAALGVSDAVAAELRERAPAPPAAAEPITVWPENAEPVALFDAMLTQWRVGPGGATGLDYAVLPGAAQSRRIAPRRAWRLLPELQVMEDEALAVMAEEMERASAEARA